MWLETLLSETRRRFAEAGLAEPAADARVLLCGVLGLSPTELISAGDKAVSLEDIARLRPAIEARIAGKPVYRILGWREFYGHRFALSAETLEPRPDTEILVDAALDFLDKLGEAQERLRILDLGIGTGAIGLAILAERSRAVCLGIDISADAVATASANAITLGVSDRYQAQTGNWFEGISGTFDLIVSNPPYIPAREIGALAAEVRDHDPVAALDGGQDGLDAYREIAAKAGGFIKPGGAVMMEIGIGQGAGIRALFDQQGFSEQLSHHDLGGIERVLSFARN